MRFRAKSHHQINALQPLIRKKVDNQQLSSFYFFLSFHSRRGPRLKAHGVTQWRAIRNVGCKHEASKREEKKKKNERLLPCNWIGLSFHCATLCNTPIAIVKFHFLPFHLSYPPLCSPMFPHEDLIPP